MTNQGRLVAYLHWIIGIGILLLPLLGNAQLTGPKPTPNDTLTSPKFLADGRVQVRKYAPMASEVTVSGDFPANRWQK